MQVFNSLEETAGIAQPTVLTIGNFDGIHLGHQVILRRVKELSSHYKLLSAVITFRNHPSTILRPNHPTHLLTSPEQKLKLLDEFGMDLVFMLEFTENFANQTAEAFLASAMHALSFRYLILGYDAKLGKDRQGDGTLIKNLAKEMRFVVERLPPFSIRGEPVSSTIIRKNIKEDDLKSARELLGRPYSIYAQIKSGAGAGKKIGYPTVNIDVAYLCTPSQGVYAVLCKIKDKLLPGIANLGFAPTLRNDHKPLLEVHLFDQNDNFYGEFAEVIFEEFIRPERQFEGIDQLREQIKEDIRCAKRILNYAT